MLFVGFGADVGGGAGVVVVAVGFKVSLGAGPASIKVAVVVEFLEGTPNLRLVGVELDVVDKALSTPKSRGLAATKNLGGSTGKHLDSTQMSVSVTTDYNKGVCLAVLLTNVLSLAWGCLGQ